MYDARKKVYEQRRVDIEYLRIIAVLLLIPFHSAMIFFSYESFYIKSPTSHFLLDYFVFFLSPWHMPLLFVIAGMSSFYAFQKRIWPQYVSERTRRLLIPFLFAMLFIVPLQPYFAYIRNHPNSNILTFTKQYLSHIQGDFTGYTGSFTPAHMWFVLYLYVYSIVSFPLLLKIKQHSEIIGKFFSKHYILFLYPIVIGFAEQLPSISSKNPFYYFTYFIVGFIIATHPNIEEVISEKKFYILILGIITMTIYLVLVEKSFTFEKYSDKDILFYILRKFNIWFWLLFILGYSKKILNAPASMLPYFSEMSYPFYILHQTVIIIIAYYIVSLNVNLWIIFFTLVLLSFFVTFMMYHFLIRKYKILRFLFGMKNQRNFGVL